MSTAFLTGIIRQKVQDMLFSSTRFALWVNQNLDDAYAFPQRKVANQSRELFIKNTSHNKELPASCHYIL